MRRSASIVLALLALCAWQAPQATDLKLSGLSTQEAAIRLIGDLCVPHGRSVTDMESIAQANGFVAMHEEDTIAYRGGGISPGYASFHRNPNFGDLVLKITSSGPTSPDEREANLRGEQVTAPKPGTRAASMMLGGDLNMCTLYFSKADPHAIEDAVGGITLFGRVLGKPEIMTQLPNSTFTGTHVWWPVSAPRSLGVNDYRSINFMFWNTPTERPYTRTIEISAPAS